MKEPPDHHRPDRSPVDTAGAGAGPLTRPSMGPTSAVARTRAIALAVACALVVASVAVILRSVLPTPGSNGNGRGLSRNDGPATTLGGGDGGLDAGAVLQKDALVQPPKHVAPEPTYTPPPRFVVPAEPQPLPLPSPSAGGRGDPASAPR